MAVKRDFGSERQINELKDRMGPQNARSGKSEKVDALVSRFLAELNDLSAEMGRSGSSGNNAAVAGKPGSQVLDLHDTVESKAQVDLDKINSEIEASLAQLETLRPTFSLPKEESLPKETQELPPPAPVVRPPDRKSLQNQPVTIQPEVEEQAWERIELFRNTIVAHKPIYRRPIVWVIAVLLILAATCFYYFGINA
jgi:hypothetical protein